MTNWEYFSGEISKNSHKLKYVMAYKCGRGNRILNFIVKAFTDWQIQSGKINQKQEFVSCLSVAYYYKSNIFTSPSGWKFFADSFLLSIYHMLRLVQESLVSVFNTLETPLLSFSDTQGPALQLHISCYTSATEIDTLAETGKGNSTRLTYLHKGSEGSQTLYGLDMAGASWHV